MTETNSLSVDMRFIKKLPSKLSITVIIAFAFTYEKALTLLKRICKSSFAMQAVSRPQLREFINDEKIKECVIEFGKEHNFFHRPPRHSIIQKLSFSHDKQEEKILHV